MLICRASKNRLLMALLSCILVTLTISLVVLSFDGNNELSEIYSTNSNLHGRFVGATNSDLHGHSVSSKKKVAVLTNALIDVSRCL